VLARLISCKYGYIQNDPGMNPHCPLSTYFTTSFVEQREWYKNRCWGNFNL